MKVVVIEKLTQLDKRYKYKMITLKDEKYLSGYESLDGTAYKFMQYYYIPIGEAKCINDYPQFA